MAQTAHRRIYPQRLQNAFMQVGEPEAEFRPFVGRLLGRVLLGLLIAAAGVGLCIVGVLYLADDLVECLVFGVMLVAFGLAIAWKMWSIWGQCFLVCPGGLVRQRGLQVKTCRWEQVRVIQETEGKTAYQIFVANGPSWPLDEDHTRQIADLVARLRQRAQKHSIKWEMVKPKKADD
jgi:hypothetical protein